MLWHLFVRKRTAYVPTVARIGLGFLDIEPVAVASVADARALKSAILDAMPLERAQQSPVAGG
jgi:hypothetical protein